MINSLTLVAVRWVKVQLCTDREKADQTPKHSTPGRPGTWVDPHPIIVTVREL